MSASKLRSLSLRTVTMPELSQKFLLTHLVLRGHSVISTWASVLAVCLSTGIPLYYNLVLRGICGGVGILAIILQWVRVLYNNYTHTQKLAFKREESGYYYFYIIHKYLTLDNRSYWSPFFFWVDSLSKSLPEM